MKSDSLPKAVSAVTAVPQNHKDVATASLLYLHFCVFVQRQQRFFLLLLVLFFLFRHADT